MRVYSQATQRPFGYITLDLHPASDDTRRLFSHLLRHEAGCMRIYTERSDNEPSIDLLKTYIDRVIDH